MADWLVAQALMGEELTRKALERARQVRPDVSSEALLAAALGIVWELVEPMKGRKLRDCPCGAVHWEFEHAWDAPKCGKCGRLGMWLPKVFGPAC